jgi:hypothetical protein
MSDKERTAMAAFRTIVLALRVFSDVGYAAFLIAHFWGKIE